MKRVLSVTVFTFAMLFTISAFAGDRTIKLSTATNINGQRLAAGEYKVQYRVSGNTAEVHFLKGKKEVASTSAHVSELGFAVPTNSIVTSENGDGTSNLVEIQFENKKTALTFSEPSVTAGK